MVAVHGGKAQYAPAAESSVLYDKILEEVQQRGNGVQNIVSGNDGNRGILDSQIAELAAKQGEKLAQLAAPVFTATAKTISANEEERKKANEQYQVPGAGFNSADLGEGGFRGISDSLAKVGGGGNYIGPSYDPILQENKEQTRVQKLMLEALKTSNRYAGSSPASFDGITV